MTSEIQSYNFNGASLRTLTDGAGEPWFVAKDACDILGMSNPSMAVTALDKDEVAQIDPKDYLGSENRSNQAVNIVSEPGLYKLIMRSRKPEAKEFQRWVTHEVLPHKRTSRSPNSRRASWNWSRKRGSRMPWPRPTTRA